MTYLDVLLSALQYKTGTVDYCGQVLVPQGKPLNRKKVHGTHGTRTSVCKAADADGAIGDRACSYWGRLQLRGSF